MRNFASNFVFIQWHNSSKQTKKTMIVCKSQVRHDFFVYYYSYLFFNMERDNSIEKITIYNLY